MQAPTGAVTLVFTDVQGSSTLWERAPDAMRAALAVHDRLMRETLGRAGGYEVKTEGDAFMAAFPEPASAVRWCLEAQVALLEADWPSDLEEFPDACEVLAPDGSALLRGLRVRMGAHAGRPECRPDPTTGRMDYFGPAVNRAARVAGVGHGGQVVVSGSVWHEIASRLEAIGSPVARDLGEHRLKGLEGTERLVQVLPAPLLAREFPPVRSLDGGGTNLPPHPASFVGRESELAALGGEIAAGARLLTILGPGGMGKTRLASRFGSTVLSDFQGPGAGGVWFCDLSACTSPDDVCGVVAQALRIGQAPGLSLDSAIDRVGQAISDRGRILLVADNFEQVVDAGPCTVGRWLEHAPQAVFLVTSRERLRLAGERVLELPPLGLRPLELPPLAQPQPSGEVAAESDAERLFLERARSVRPGYAQGRPEAEAVTEIVRALDGIPLAIELAAARAAILPPGQLLERLRGSLDALGGGSRDAPSRQATLRAAIDWSLSLLEPWERSALAQCAVFRGSWDLAAAEAVVDLAAHPGAPPVLDVMQALKDKSLLRFAEDGARLGMYVTLHEYASERLALSGEEAGALDRHTAHFARRCDGMVPWYRDGLEQRLVDLAPDLDNLEDVFQRALAVRPATAGSLRTVLQVGLVLEYAASRRGPIERRFGIQDTAIAYAEAGRPGGPLLGWLHEARGRGLITAGRQADGQAAFERAAALGRASGDRLLPATAMRGMALVARSENRLEDSLRLCEDALVVMRELGDKAGQGLLLGSLASFWQQVNRHDQAIGLYTEALSLFGEMDSPRLECEWLINLGLLHQEAGRFGPAEAHFEKVLAISARTRDGSQSGYALGFLAGLDFERGNLDAALDRYLEAVQALGRVGERFMRFIFLASLGGCLGAADRLADADVTLGAAERLGTGQGAVAPLVVSLFRGFWHLAHGRRLEAAGDGDTAAEHLEAARGALAAALEPLADTPAGGMGDRAIDQSEDVRFAARLLGRALAALPLVQAAG